MDSLNAVLHEHAPLGTPDPVRQAEMIEGIMRSHFGSDKYESYVQARAAGSVKEK